MPLVRHLFWWLGVRSASRSCIRELLLSNKSVVLVPGGIREIQHMKQGKEVVFLKERRGFIKLALQTGCPLLPVFAFGQSDSYRLFPIGPPLLPITLTNAIGRCTGIQPLYAYGRWGTTIPLKAPLLVVFGIPIQVPKTAEPDTETVQLYLNRFINQMKELFEEYKKEAGYPDLTLEVV